MNTIKFIPILMLLCVVAVVGDVFAQGMSNTRHDWSTPWSPGQVIYTPSPDYLNPFTADRADWDPYAPGSEYQASPADWDPYAPYGSSTPTLVSANPLDMGLSISGDLRIPNQMYLQQGNSLVTSGSVILGDQIVIWVYVQRPGSLYIYDTGKVLISQGYVTAGWYRVDGLYAEIFTSHYYQMAAAGISANNVSLTIDAGGYPTTKSLVGRVINQNGYGMSEVDVKISNNEGGAFTTKTDDMGYYGMDLASGYYQIKASKDGYSFTSSVGRVWTGTVSTAGIIVGTPTSTQTTTPDNVNTNVASIIGSDQGMINGYVTDGLGMPISSALVSVGQSYVVTNDDGYYEMMLDPGWYTLAIGKPGYSFESEAVQVIEGRASQANFKSSTI